MIQALLQWVLAMMLGDVEADVASSECLAGTVH
jgi:hypothetical protein